MAFRPERFYLTDEGD